MTRWACVLTVACLLGAAPAAQADYDPVGSGATEIAFDKSFLRLLASGGVKLEAVAPARLKGGRLKVPAVGGKFDPVSEKGTVEHDGTLVFRSGKRKILLSQLKLRTTQSRAPYTAKVGGSQLKIATTKGVKVTRDGFGDKVDAGTLALSSKLAVRLGKKLDQRDLFRPGLRIGTARTREQPATTTLLRKGGGTLTFAPEFVAKLESLHVAVNPIFPAEHQGPVFSLPTFGGALAPDASTGRIETSGAIELLQLGGGQVFWRELWADLGAGTLSAEVDVEPAPPYAGKVGRGTVAALGPSGDATSMPASRAITTSATTLTLDAAAAATFNEVFAAPAGSPPIFAAGEPLGTISFSLIGQ
jgi:hypothetical protein